MYDDFTERHGWGGSTAYFVFGIFWIQYGPEDSLCSLRFFVFSSVVPDKCREIASLRSRPLAVTTSTGRYSHIVVPFDGVELIWVADSVVKETKHKLNNDAISENRLSLK
jgi:hypothetical protein